MASNKRTHDDATDGNGDVVHRTTSWKTTTTTAATTTTTTMVSTTTVVTATANGLGTTKETAIEIEDDPDVIPIEKQPAKKKAKKATDVGTYPCGSKMWVRIEDELVSAYNVAPCLVCPKHPHAPKPVYLLPFFMHDEYGDYECPDGDCAGTLRYVCFVCRRFRNSKRV